MLRNKKTHKDLGLLVGEEFNPYDHYMGMFIPNWLARRTEIHPGAKLTYARLLQYAGKDGRAFPKIDTLAREIGYGYRQTQRFLSELSNYKLIVVDTNKEKHLSSDYRFLVHEWAFESEDQVPTDSGEHNPIGKSSPQPKGSRVSAPKKSYSSRLGSPIANVSEDAPLLKEEEEEIQVNTGESFALSGVSSVSPEEEPRLTESSRVKTPPKAEPGSRGKPKHWDAPPKRPATYQAPQGYPSPSRAIPVLSGGVASDPEEEARLARIRAHHATLAQKSTDEKTRKEGLKRNLGGTPKSPTFTKIVTDAESNWRANMALKYPDLQQALWGQKEKGQIKTLVDKYGVELVRLAIEYWITQFAGISKRIMKGKATLPTLGLFCGLHETIFAEAQLYMEVVRAKKKIDAWMAENPHSFLVPDELTRVYEDAVKKSGLPQ